VSPIHSNNRDIKEGRKFGFGYNSSINGLKVLKH